LYLSHTNLQQKLYEALKSKYETEFLSGQATLAVYFKNPVGIGEHPQILDEMDKQIEKMEHAKGKLSILEMYKPSGV